MRQLLLIDGDPATLVEFGAMLRKAGYEVLTTSCARDVLTLLEQREPAGGEPGGPLHARVMDGLRVLRVTDGRAVDVESDEQRESHAAARWARTVIAVMDARNDPRTVADWSRLIVASPGAVRSWCLIAGISPRRSLVFARLLRAVVLSDGGHHRLENLLDVVDRRTLKAVLGLAGLNLDAFPRDVEEFLRQQTVIRDEDMLREVRRAVQERLNRRHAAP